MKNKIHYLLYTATLLYSLIVFSQNKPAYDLKFNPAGYKVQELSLNGKSFKVRAYENIVYVANPVDTSYQKINIYVPEEYFMGKKINGYAAATAPIFFPNEIGGYMPAVPATALPSKKGKFPGAMGGMPPGVKPPEGAKLPQGAMPMGMMDGNRPSAVLTALSKGYVVASAGARGRTTKDAGGTYTGKAPAVIVDLKAAIRYLKFNDSRMPGDANKVVSNGTSAGGALSVLLGATGNNPDYEPYLKALGAANATDDIFAVSAYCPITNLDNADTAYEWQFNSINTVEQRKFPGMGAGGSSVLSGKQAEVSSALKKSFTNYVNSLKLTGSKGEQLTLDDKGNGPFKEYVKKYVIASAQKELDKGTDLSKHAWLTIKNKKVTAIDFEGYIAYMTRMKTPPAFDAVDLSAGENQLFGTAKIDKQHFTAFSVKNTTETAAIADAAIIKMMNPMDYIGQANTSTSKYWRIRHGSKDSDTGLAVSVILATQLEDKGYSLDYALPWDKPHSGDYDLDELFAWADGICKKQ